MRRSGTWWRARSRRAKALVVATALALVVVAVRVDGQADPEPAAAEPAETQPGAAAATARHDDEPQPEADAEPRPGERQAERENAALPHPKGESSAVARVIDGDTIALATGTVVRLVQIDTPEIRGSECYAQEAASMLESLLPVGTKVRIETDPNLDQVDRYGRRLAYVLKGRENVNMTLVQRGAASVWFYQGGRGKYADDLLAAAEGARAAGRGLWAECEATLDPFAALATAPRTGSSPAAPEPVSEGGRGDACHPGYEPCLPMVADMNCPQVRALGKAPVRVKVSGDDPYRLDRDRDGVGCE